MMNLSYCRGMALVSALVFTLAAIAPITGTVVGTDAGTPAAAPWAPLRRRPLDLPELAPGALCPRSEWKRFTPFLALVSARWRSIPWNWDPMGSSTTAPSGGGHADGGWFNAKVIWAATPDYTGPILVRGRQLDGPNEVRFDDGTDPPREKRLDDPAATTVGAPGLRLWTGYTRVRAPGGYAYLVDGLDFREVTVFQAVGESPGELTPVPVWEEDGTYPLPRELVVHSGVRLADGTVRLALRLDVGPSQDAPLGLSGRDLETAEVRSAGSLAWSLDGRG